MYTSRGMESIAAVLFTGSRLSTIIVSVFCVVDESGRESIPRSSTLTRSVPVHAGRDGSCPAAATSGAFAIGAKILAKHPAHVADPRYAAVSKATSETHTTPRSAY